MDYQNGSASKTSMIQQVVHNEQSEAAGKRTFLHIFQLNQAKKRLYLRQRLEYRHRRPLSMIGPVQPVHTQGPEAAKLARRSRGILRLLADLQLLCDEGERDLSHLRPPVVDGE